MRLVYLRERKGLPSLEAQRAALLAAGLTDAEIEAAYIDRKVRPGETMQRDHIPGATRTGDEVWVARLGVLATSEAEAIAFTVAITRHGTVLRDAATGGKCAIPPEALNGVAAGLLLAAAIRADERAAVMERARRGRKGGKAGGRQPTDPKRLEAAKAYWFNHDISGDEAAERTGISKRTLARYLGKRGSPAFGAALNKRRQK